MLSFDLTAKMGKQTVAMSAHGHCRHSPLNPDTSVELNSLADDLFHLQQEFNDIKHGHTSLVTCQWLQVPWTGLGTHQQASWVLEFIAAFNLC